MLSSSKGIVPVTKRIAAVHHRSLHLKRVRSSRTSHLNEDEYVATVPNMTLLQEHKLSPVTMASIEEDEYGTADRTSGGRREECSVLSLSLKQKRGGIRGENSLLAASVIEYKV